MLFYCNGLTFCSNCGGVASAVSASHLLNDACRATLPEGSKSSVAKALKGIHPHSASTTWPDGSPASQKGQVKRVGNNVLTPLETTVSMKSKRKTSNSRTQSARSEEETFPPGRVRGAKEPGKGQGRVAGPNPGDTGTSASPSEACSDDESKKPQASEQEHSTRSEEAFPPGRVRGGSDPGTRQVESTGTAGDSSPAAGSPSGVAGPSSPTTASEPTAAPKAASVRRTRVDRSRFKF